MKSNIPLKSIKLTTKQNMIINCLQNGWELITSSDSNIVVCCSKLGQFEFSSTLFYRLVNMGLIHQGSWEKTRHGYELTNFGRLIKTKDVQKAINEKLSMIYKYEQ